MFGRFYLIRFLHEGKKKQYHASKPWNGAFARQSHKFASYQ
jgi:hypothetical protein